MGKIQKIQFEKTIIYSDLDGTLLDEDTYSFSGAIPALEIISDNSIPLVFCSSKTRSEMELWRTRLKNDHPFISENGGGIFIPNGYFPFYTDPESVKFGSYQLIRLGSDYDFIRREFVSLRKKYGADVRGFGDMEVAEIADLTGLDEENARYAKIRDFDEPFIFNGSPDNEFLAAIESAGLNWTIGKLYHILGRHDKGYAINILEKLFKKKYGELYTLGLGDSINDKAILKNVAYPVLIRRKNGAAVDLGDLAAITSKNSGPEGWNEVMMDFLYSGLPRENPYFPLLKKIYRAAISAVDPYKIVMRSIRVENEILRIEKFQYNLKKFKKIIVIGAGKGAGRMALAVENILPNFISDGLVVVPKGSRENLTIIRNLEASHPVPDAASEQAAETILNMVKSAGADTLVICLLSGGASSLLAAPAAGLSLQNKQQTTQMLFHAGASIEELNTVRKHLSAIKGGNLLKAAYPARVSTIIISDVIGNRSDIIASGPTSADLSTFADALSVFEKYDLSDKIPAEVLNYLEMGNAGFNPETIKEDDLCIKNSDILIAGSIKDALAGAKNESIAAGIDTEIFSDCIQGESREAGKLLAEIAANAIENMKKNQKLCVLSGGETTVTVKGKGRGGRNQELALAFANEIKSRKNISLLSAGTDGIDGLTNAAGALVDGTTVPLADHSGLHADSCLDDNNSWEFFNELDSRTGSSYHFKPGQTGTNVMDIQIMLLES
jgi:mannosyl-3-phosphoglycerate phosphatase family protein